MGVMSGPCKRSSQILGVEMLATGLRVRPRVNHEIEI